MTWISWRGVEIGERIQNILLGIQYLALAIFVVAALWQFFAGTAPDPTPFDWSWFNPFALHRLDAASSRRSCSPCSSTGAGTRASPSTRRRRTPSASPGRAALLTTVILLVTYVGVTVAAMMYAGLGEERHRARQRGQRRRLLPRDQGRPARPGRLGPRGRRADLGDLVDADHDPARPRAARSRWRSTGRCRSGSRPCTRRTRRRRSRRS